MAQQCVQQNGQQHQPATGNVAGKRLPRTSLTDYSWMSFQVWIFFQLHSARLVFRPSFSVGAANFYVFFSLLFAQSARVSCHHSHLHWRVPYTACHISISHGSCWCFLPIHLRIPSDKLKAHYFTPSCALTHCGAILRTRRVDRFKQHASRKHAPDIGNYLVRCLYAWHSRVRNNNNKNK